MHIWYWWAFIWFEWKKIICRNESLNKIKQKKLNENETYSIFIVIKVEMIIVVFHTKMFIHYYLFVNDLCIDAGGNVATCVRLCLTVLFLRFACFHFSWQYSQPGIVLIDCPMTDSHEMANLRRKWATKMSLSIDADEKRTRPGWWNDVPVCVFFFYSLLLQRLVICHFSLSHSIPWRILRDMSLPSTAINHKYLEHLKHTHAPTYPLWLKVLQFVVANKFRII